MSPQRLGGRMNALVTAACVRALRSRGLMRAPIWIFRARLGGLFADRLLMLEHLGRRSGTRRRVVLEVIDHPGPGTYVVSSGFGDRAQWLKNLNANGSARLYTATRRAAPASARVLPPVEAERALSAYITRHPAAWSRMKPVLEVALGHPITDLGTAMPVVELQCTAA